jgi:hypothetical protein
VRVDLVGDGDGGLGCILRRVWWRLCLADSNKKAYHSSFVGQFQASFALQHLPARLLDPAATEQAHSAVNPCGWIRFRERQR